MIKELNGASYYKILSHEEKLKQNISQDPIIHYVDALLYQAICMHASDIHLQPEEDAARVRIRVDGVLYDHNPVQLQIYAAVISRIKILSSLDIAITRLPQDGKLTLLKDENIIDLRISTFPSLYGEKMVIRILDRSHNMISLEALGFTDRMLKQMHIITSQSHGFFLTTGPTGSGKTTTLYALLSLLNKPDINIVTMEDPIEYDLPGITQSQVNERAGFTFDIGLRSLLRQDPDIIMIGEIRDKLTVQIAIESALTGHLVLSTLHTNDAAGAITRLLDMGIEPFLINATLTGVLAQRLARILCPACKKEVTLTQEEQKQFAAYGIPLTTIFQATGCHECFNLGYKGRMSVFELLLIDDALRELISQKASSEKIREQALTSGLLPLMYDGLCKVKAGLISLEELLSVVTH